MSEICTASLLPADFAHFFMWQRNEALRLQTDKEERRDLEPGAELLSGTGHLKWRHAYVIMITEFDYFEHDHILYTVGKICKLCYYDYRIRLF